MNYSRQETHLKREINEERKQLVLRCDSVLQVDAVLRKSNDESVIKCFIVFLLLMIQIKVQWKSARRRRNKDSCVMSTETPKIAFFLECVYANVARLL